jgi:uncharacterized protein DUF5667
MHETHEILETYLGQILAGTPAPAPSSPIPLGLGPMLQAARRVHQLAGIEPSPTASMRTRVALRRAAASRASRESRPARGGLWRRPAVGLAFAVMLLALGTTSVLAAPSALPDSPLYDVRHWREAVEVRLAGSPAERAKLYAGFALARSAQLQQLSKQQGGVAPAVVQTLLRDIRSQVADANQEARDDGQASRVAVQQAEREIEQHLNQVGEQTGSTGGGNNDDSSQP